jgi:preprotein translocase subunit SecG
MLLTVLTIVQVFASLAIVALVLLQRGRGADAGAGFGAGASGSVFGARGATTGLSRSTAVFAAVFMINSLALAWLGTRPSTEAPKGLLGEQAESRAPAVVPAPAPAPSDPAGALPASVPAPAPAN